MDTLTQQPITMRPAVAGLLLGLCFLLASATALAITPAAEKPQVIRQAEFMLSDSPTPPGKNLSGWQSVTLLDAWHDERYRQGRNGWYRIPLGGLEPGNEPWGILLERVNMNAAVYFNGQPLGDGGSFDEPLARNWNRTLYFSIPALLWRPDNNVIQIRLKSYPGYGLLGPVHIGNARRLESIHQHRTLITNDVSEVLFFLTLGAGVFMFALWLRRLKDRMYLWFAVTSVCWSLYSLNNFIHDIPVSATTWDWLIYSSTAWWTSALAMFCHSFAAIKRPRIERLFLGFVLVSTLAYGVSGLQTIKLTTMIFQTGSILIGSIAVIELALFKAAPHSRSSHQPQPLEIRLLALGIAIVLAAGIYDWMVQASILAPGWHFSIHVLHYTAPALFIFIAWHLIGRFVHALNESEQLNQELEYRIDLARQTIERHFSKIQAMEKQQAITHERERIYRDLHDDVGAKLLSLSFRAGDHSTADLARSALQDLRDVVTRSSKDELKLEHALADWRAECTDRLEATGAECDWETSELPEHTLSASEIMNLGRILRETISNAMNHAHATRVWVRVGYTAPVLKLDIDNDNCSGDPTSWTSGRGLNSIRSRARELGGDASWSKPTDDVCRLSLAIPLANNT